MNFERAPAQQQSNKEKPELQERINELELRVQRLIGETEANLQNLPDLQKLASTAEGQSKLLKVQEGVRRFNQRVLGIVALINAPTVLQMAASGYARALHSNWGQILESGIDWGGRITATSLFIACIIIAIRSMKMREEADKIFDAIGKQT